uniref:SFRICE_007317 n=1 Tax=Spodoptera frugiperda TaxID=7108 RepID=A0A2H1VDF3_SPOFR
MQCNQSFCGNGFTNGFYSCSNNNAPLQTSYPEIVGEGEVTSVTLPDGTIQFFFIPTVKWWTPVVPPCYPPYSNVRGPPFHPNYSASPYSINAGTWFIRSISNPVPLAQPQNPFIPTCQRTEVPRLRFASDCLMNTGNNGFQLKFHNDGCSSTTDLHYFCPSLRKEAPCKGTANVQIDTPITSTVCHYEVVCGKPCNCKPAAKPPCPQTTDSVTQPMSLESICDCRNTKSNNTITTDDCSCEDLSKKRNKRSKDKKSKRKKKKKEHVVCCCDAGAGAPTADKSMATYDEKCCCTAATPDKTKTVPSKEKNTCRLQKLSKLTSCSKTCKPVQFLNSDAILKRCEVKTADTWRPNTAFSKRAMKDSPSANFDSEIELNAACNSNCGTCSGDNISDN